MPGLGVGPQHVLLPDNPVVQYPWVPIVPITGRAVERHLAQRLGVDIVDENVVEGAGAPPLEGDLGAADGGVEVRAGQGMGDGRVPSGSQIEHVGGRTAGSRSRPRDQVTVRRDERRDGRLHRRGDEAHLPGAGRDLDFLLGGGRRGETEQDDHDGHDRGQDGYLHSHVTPPAAAFRSFSVAALSRPAEGLVNSSTLHR